MFYILIKNPEHYLVVKQKLTEFCCDIYDVRGVLLNNTDASEIYADIKTQPYFQNAVDSIKNRTVLILRFSHAFMNLEEIKKNIQGPYGNFDDSTIRGYITIYLNNGVVDSFVHVPDTLSSVEHDLLVFSRCCS
jgi:nucleoside diphosphate kinase